MGKEQDKTVADYFWRFVDTTAISISMKDLKRHNIGRSNSIELSCSKKRMKSVSSLSFPQAMGGLSISS